MGTSTLAAIRARLTQADNKQTKSFDNTLFPFWNAKNDTTSIVRFLPDGDSSNTYFWVEKLQIRLPFNGIKGGDTKPVMVNVPCVEMFNDKAAYPSGCPILSEVRLWYKDETLKEKANKYWKKPQYIMQGFVRENAVADDKAPENPIRRFMLNKQIFNLIKAGLMDADMINLPCDYTNGTDFRLIKTQKSQYADYGTSSYARRESALTQVELDAIEKYGLTVLKDFLGERPSADAVTAIRGMFEASVDGEAYDESKWGAFYKPASLWDNDNKEKDSKSVNVPAAKTETQVEAKNDPAVESTPAASGETKSAAAILEMIKARGAKKAETKA